MIGELDHQSPVNPSRLLERIEESLDLDPTLFEVEEFNEERVLSGTVPSKRDLNRLERFVYDQLSLDDLRLDVTVDELLQGETQSTGGSPHDTGSEQTSPARDLL